MESLLKSDTFSRWNNTVLIQKSCILLPFFFFSFLIGQKCLTSAKELIHRNLISFFSSIPDSLYELIHLKKSWAVCWLFKKVVRILNQHLVALVLYYVCKYSWTSSWLLWCKKTMKICKIYIQKREWRIQVNRSWNSSWTHYELKFYICCSIFMGYWLYRHIQCPLSPPNFPIMKSL